MYDDGDYEASVHIDFLMSFDKTHSLARGADGRRNQGVHSRRQGSAVPLMASRDAGPKSSTAPTPRACGRAACSQSAPTQQRRDQPAQKSGRSDVSDEQRGWDDLQLALAISASESETKGSNGGATPVSSELDITAEALWELCAPDVANAEEGASGAPSAAPTATTALSATEEEAKQTEKEEYVDEADEVALMGDMGLERARQQRSHCEDNEYSRWCKAWRWSSHDVREGHPEFLLDCNERTVLSGVPRATPPCRLLRVWPRRLSAQWGREDP